MKKNVWSLREWPVKEMDALGAIKIYKIVPCWGIRLEEVTRRDALQVHWTTERAQCKPKNELSKEKEVSKRLR